MLFNFTWINFGKTVSEFLTTLANNFDSELQLVDFKDAAERQQASVTINQWVNKSTEGMIKELISDQDLSEDTRLILGHL